MRVYAKLSKLGRQVLLKSTGEEKKTRGFAYEPFEPRRMPKTLLFISWFFPISTDRDGCSGRTPQWVPKATVVGAGWLFQWTRKEGNLHDARPIWFSH